ncbi:hypothetical protein ACOSQ4_003306 [Xanthoceras sorbifolium]
MLVGIPRTININRDKVKLLRINLILQPIGLIFSLDRFQSASHSSGSPPIAQQHSHHFPPLNWRLLAQFCSSHSASECASSEPPWSPISTILMTKTTSGITRMGSVARHMGNSSVGVAILHIEEWDPHTGGMKCWNCVLKTPRNPDFCISAPILAIGPSSSDKESLAHRLAISSGCISKPKRKPPIVEIKERRGNIQEDAISEQGSTRSACKECVIGFYQLGLVAPKTGAAEELRKESSFL